MLKFKRKFRRQRVKRAVRRISFCCILVDTPDTLEKTRGQVYLRTGHEGPKGEKKYSPTLSLSSALDVGGWVINAMPRQVYPGKDPVPVLQEAGWAPDPVWKGAKYLAPTGIRSPDRPACSESLYGLS